MITLVRWNGEPIAEGKSLREVVEAHESDLALADLTNQDLTGARLDGADLGGANLQRAAARRPPGGSENHQRHQGLHAVAPLRPVPLPQWRSRVDEVSRPEDKQDPAAGPQPSCGA